MSSPSRPRRARTRQMSGAQRTRPGRATGRAARLLALLAFFAVMAQGAAGAWAASCPAGAGPPEPVLSRLPLYEAGREVPIRSWSRGDPGASAEFAFTAAGSEEDARALRVS